MGVDVGMSVDVDMSVGKAVGKQPRIGTMIPSHTACGARTLIAWVGDATAAPSIAMMPKMMILAAIMPAGRLMTRAYCVREQSTLGRAYKWIVGQS